MDVYDKPRLQQSMSVQRGQVVLVDFPFSDRTGSKVRPALVVQDDDWNAALDDTILALISGSRRRNVGSPTQRFIAVNSPEAIGPDFGSTPSFSARTSSPWIRI